MGQLRHLDGKLARSRWHFDKPMVSGGNSIVSGGDRMIGGDGFVVFRGGQVVYFDS